MIEVLALQIPEVKVIVPRVFGDLRGWFGETYNRARYSELGIDVVFVQDNQSYSSEAGTIRGLHFQSRPCAQTKLVRVLSGRIFDVAVDLRVSSPTYKKWVGEELSAENHKQLFVPVGFAHGFCVLEAHTHVLYKVDAHYSAAHDSAIAWDDPEIGIEWPVDKESVILSDKDAAAPLLSALLAPF